ncbi:uncharacterized protein N7477_000356 [Penicillium maclennaniae]|uniref:uncharacterized protein n=1 Tax=Penicillium maclennaniae TaxID=1343394 RepID=UPI0025421F0A|nr:uncharacterized protein N7477_000356 [Penicillium maclennaniae]KAJ5684011.1 hypothetical protein N7477_000356 [Penicillium maclennaniae]
MTLLENPGISTLPSFSNIKEASEPIKGPSDLEAPSITVKSAINDLNSGLSTRSHFAIEEHPIDVVRPITVGIIGAGIAGITAGVLLPAKLPGLDLRIYDKNADVAFGVTYLHMRINLASPPILSGREEFAQGAEIRDYWQSVARKHNVYQYQRVNKTEWLADEGKWKVTIAYLDGSNKIYEEKLDVIINAIGHFNAWQLPDYEGIEHYRGALFHSSNWNHTIDLKGKRIALIGNGASGLQVLPSIEPIASHIDHYARNPTWIADSFSSGSTGVRRLEPNTFSEAQLESFKDPNEYLKYRTEVEKGYFQRFGAIFKDTPENQELREKWTSIMLHRFSAKPDLKDKILPDFPPNCRRPTPGLGYLEALTKDHVDYIQTRIKRFTETGIVTEDGVERAADITICATGANVDHAPPFSIIANGIDLQSAWKKDGLFGFPYSYLGFATPGFPNLLWLGGPYASGHSGTVPNSLENQLTYIAKVLRKIRSQGIKSMAPSKQATDDFVEYCDNFYPRTVWTANCSSWYNGGTPGSRIHGLFPGSASHANYIRRDPRWEDWEYNYVNPGGNRLAYFGNGWTSKELEPEAELTPHLRLPEEVDLKSWMEGWWDV